MENLNLIRKIAWSFHQTTGFDFQELFAEASLAYCELLKDACQPTQNNEAKFSYRAWIRMENQLINYTKLERIQNSMIAIKESQASCFQISPFSDFWEDLSPECQLIAQTTFQIVEESVDIKPKMVRGQVFRKLRDDGWTWERIWDGFREMKNTLAYS